MRMRAWCVFQQHAIRICMSSWSFTRAEGHCCAALRTKTVAGVETAFEAPDRVQNVQAQLGGKVATVQAQQGACCPSQVAHKHCIKQCLRALCMTRMP